MRIVQLSRFTSRFDRSVDWDCCFDSFSSHLHLTVEGCCVQVDCWVIQNPQLTYQSLALVCLWRIESWWPRPPTKPKTNVNVITFVSKKTRRANEREWGEATINWRQRRHQHTNRGRATTEGERRRPTINQQPRFNVDVLWKRELWLIITRLVVKERDQRSAEKERVSGLFHDRRRSSSSHVERSRRGWRWMLNETSDEREREERKEVSSLRTSPRDLSLICQSDRTVPYVY